MKVETLKRIEHTALLIAQAAREAQIDGNDAFFDSLETQIHEHFDTLETLMLEE
jgi:hypothetical protein